MIVSAKNQKDTILVSNKKYFLLAKYHMRAPWACKSKS